MFDCTFHKRVTNVHTGFTSSPSLCSEESERRYICCPLQGVGLASFKMKLQGIYLVFFKTYLPSNLFPVVKDNRRDFCNESSGWISVTLSYLNSY